MSILTGLRDGGVRIGKFFAAISLALFLNSFGYNPLHAQVLHHCGTVEYMEKLRQENRLRETIPMFEDWLRRHMVDQRNKAPTGRAQAGPYEVPVVVHVIHNGESVGTGTNIPDAQIISQIDVINDDFKRLNSDTANTPSEFRPVASSIDVQFVLARQDPEGLPTNGVTRTQGTKTGWTMDDNNQLKSLSYWPAEDYLNIWVCNLTDLLGYAQFPVSSLPGLQDASENRLTDGIVVTYNAFGTIDAGAFNLRAQYNKGRTTTHEIGHFFGLRHIWGDSEVCGATDYVDDTPDQMTSTDGCPSHPRPSCGSDDMFQNYLDYTDDACMNIFTEGQVGRMTVAIENSPRRMSLLTSHGLIDPSTVANDLGIRKIRSPSSLVCNNPSAIALEVRNYGNNTITSARLTVSRNGSPLETKDFALSLDPLAIDEISFSAITVNTGDSVSFEVVNVNGVPDANDFNNFASVVTRIQSTGNIPFTQKFDASPPDWLIQNPDSKVTWQVVGATNGEPGNTALEMNFFNYKNVGETDILLSPVFDFTPLDSATLSFAIAYRKFPNYDGDALKVVVLTDCETDLSKGTVIYDKSGDALATVAGTITSSYSPSNSTDWRNEVRSLNDFVGQSQVQLAFVGVNGNGNNLFLDNISVLAIAFEDISLEAVTYPSPVICTNETSLGFQVMNRGPISVASLDVDYTVNGGTSHHIHYSDLEISTEQVLNLQIPSLQLSSGSNEVYIEISSPNGQTDSIPGNNAKSFLFAVANNTDVIPLREDFSMDPQGRWTIINQHGGQTWETITTNAGVSAYFNGHDDILVGDVAWLVSPVLDMTASTEASMFFDLSYAQNGNRKERLQVLGSADCGLSYQTLFDQQGQSMATTVTSGPWMPSSPADWQRHYVDLTSIAGNPGSRIAFVVTNDHGNNLFIDNIEFFTAANPAPLQTENPFAIYSGSNADFLITFNLAERQTVLIDVLDTMGRNVVHATEDNVLNQTFPVQFEGAAGVYIVRLGINGQYFAARVFVGR